MTYCLDQAHTDPKRLRRERDKARELRSTPWWREKIRAGVCEYCSKIFAPKDLTMDHVVPLARGGMSTRSNIVPSCQECNRHKRLETPVERLLKEIGFTST